MDDIKDYINHILIEKKLSNNTKDAYYNDLEKFYNYINKDIYDITSNDIRKYINHLSDEKISSKSISRKIVSIRTFYDYLVKNKKINANPCEKIESPKLSKKEKEEMLIKIENEMREAAKNMDFERAMELRDILFELKSN